jgi:toxin ParE1/3/4
MRRAHYTSKSRADIDEIAEYIASDNLDAAIESCLAVEDAVEKLAEMPGMGQRREFKNPAIGSIRSWPVKGFGKYLIFYRPSPEGIEVLRIVHGARDIDMLLQDR